jgi:hypothetical protein
VKRALFIVVVAGFVSACSSGTESLTGPGTVDSQTPVAAGCANRGQNIIWGENEQSRPANIIWGETTGSCAIEP